MSNTALSFDTLQYSKKSREAGFYEHQAEVQTEALRELIDDKLGTKEDLRQLDERLTYKVTIRLVSLIVVGVLVLAALIKF